ncbi:MAG: hypothetical protein J1E56_03475, partial [Ruminococcus sp.]|nr:hypothetical protein [Ruminococcus sp.]
VTQIQLWLAKFNVDFKIGELVKKEINSTDPTTPSETDPTTVTDPTTETEPTTSTDPDSDTIRFYVPNYVTWLTDVGGKLWIYNDETKEFKTMEYNEDDKYFYLDIPVEWSVLSIYRTAYEIEADQFDINSKWNEDTQTGCILNEWVNLGSRGENDCYFITADGEGYYTMYEPPADDEYMRTIYFDNSKAKWSTVYIYGWSFGLSQEFVQMTPVGNDIWSYTFFDPDLPIDGVKGFLFVNKNEWNGQSQTVDLATEKGKDLFTPNSGTGTSITGSWSVYEP